MGSGPGQQATAPSQGSVNDWAEPSKSGRPPVSVNEAVLEDSASFTHLLFTPLTVSEGGPHVRNRGANTAYGEDLGQ